MRAQMKTMKMAHPEPYNRRDEVHARAKHSPPSISSLQILQLLHSPTHRIPKANRGWVVGNTLSLGFGTDGKVKSRKRVMDKMNLERIRYKD
ncbi:hypothetical protein HPP92_001717 [Vanilla planifolia]|uniref:Uncharacterized protein n=1 Tax=Vanilla planifolia TaxID=51239 RepID=A0A835RYR1_VANPL|nr:hypothetical protein HPP92_001717 [Vanilla planifolia]